MQHRRYRLMTLGCKVNQYESRAYAEELGRLGYLEASADEAADLVVINTCTVTHRSDADGRNLVRRAKREHPGALVAVTGCYARMEPETLREAGADLVVDTAEKHRLIELVTENSTGLFAGKPMPQGPLGPEPVTRFGERSRAFIKVQEGCETFCAYCIVPFARGPSRSLPPELVAEGLERIREAGHREVVLTGVHLGNWGRDLAPPRPFTGLLDLAEASGIDRVRLSSLEPLEVTGEVVQRIAASESLCPHLHVPLQSGSDRILAAMGRPYDAAAFASRMEAAFEAIEGLCLGLDVIVGFPGEGDPEFDETLKLLESLPLAYLHVFPFSPREGTPAATMAGQVEPQVIKARAARLRDLSRLKKREFYRSRLGTVLMGLPERPDGQGRLKVRGREYVEAVVPWQGQLPDYEIAIRLVGWDGDILLGERSE